MVCDIQQCTLSTCYIARLCARCWIREIDIKCHPGNLLITNLMSSMKEKCRVPQVCVVGKSDLCWDPQGAVLWDRIQHLNRTVERRPVKGRWQEQSRLGVQKITPVSVWHKL